MQLPAVAALALGLAFAAPAHADTLADIQAAGKLVVATEMQFPPFDFKENGEYTGVDKDLLDEVGKELGVEVEYVDLPWTSVLPGLEAGKYDFVGAPLNASQARMERYAFSSPIAYSGNAFVKRKGNDEVQKPEDLAGKTVGVLKASSSQKQVAAYSETLPEAINIREYSDMLSVYADVANGRLDAGASSLPNVSYASVQRPDQLEVVEPPFGKPNYYGWVTRKDPEDQSLIEAVSAALEAMKADGRMAEIQMKWFGKTEDLPDTMPVPDL
ncbi:transporter substrate-binding domain-containing protein [Acuticoccus sediminis]|uniref:transporter substrate-binding domain-containing protein n=1 Tax=Acuticoccus sediminis TaxID=2184697 RepID=UPI001CFE9F42|nr:transporter substrate-binding domain-containing protein [Acuticoccus sediminis]